MSNKYRDTKFGAGIFLVCIFVSTAMGACLALPPPSRPSPFPWPRQRGLIQYAFYPYFLCVATLITIHFNLLQTGEEKEGMTFYPELEAMDAAAPDQPEPETGAQAQAA